MIGSCNCPITLSDYNFADKLEQNTAVYAPIAFEETVIVMYKREIKVLTIIFKISMTLGSTIEI